MTRGPAERASILITQAVDVPTCQSSGVHHTAWWYQGEQRPSGERRKDELRVWRQTRPCKTVSKVVDVVQVHRLSGCILIRLIKSVIQRIFSTSTFMNKLNNFYFFLILAWHPNLRLWHMLSRWHHIISVQFAILCHSQNRQIQRA